MLANNGSVRHLGTTAIVTMSGQDAANIKAFVDYAAGECQWFMIVDVIKDPKGQYIQYHLSRIYIPEQVASAATVDTPAAGMMSVLNDITSAYRVDGKLDTEKMQSEVMSKLSVWCHSHVNMACSPSGTDMTTFQEFIKDGPKGSPVVMMIVNKKDEVFLRIHDPTNGVYVEHPKLVIQEPKYDTSEVIALAKARLKAQTFYGATSVGSWRGYGWNGDGKWGELSPKAQAGSQSRPKHHHMPITSAKIGGQEDTIELPLSAKSLIEAGKEHVKNLHKKNPGIIDTHTRYLKEIAAGGMQKPTDKLLQYFDSFFKVLPMLLPDTQAPLFAAFFQKDFPSLTKWVESTHLPFNYRKSLSDFLTERWTGNADEFFLCVGLAKMGSRMHNSKNRKLFMNLALQVLEAFVISNTDIPSQT